MTGFRLCLIPTPVVCLLILIIVLSGCSRGPLESAKASVVAVYAQKEWEEKDWFSSERKKVVPQASGIIIDKHRGLVLTCRHVVSPLNSSPLEVSWGLADRVSIVDANGVFHEAQVVFIAEDKDVDLALIKCAGRLPEEISQFESEGLNAGSRLFMVGAPDGRVGAISESVFDEMDDRYIKYGGIVSQTWSGSILVDERGRGIGVVCQSLPRGGGVGMASEAVTGFLRRATRNIAPQACKYRVRVKSAHISRADASRVGARVGDGKPEIYIQIKKGSLVVYKTSHANSGKNPAWESEVYDMDWSPGQFISVQVMDRDIHEHDEVGRYSHGDLPQKDKFPLNGKLPLQHPSDGNSWVIITAEQL